MPKRMLPTPETFEALVNLLGLKSLSSVRTIKISFVSGEPVTVDVEMFVWDHDVLTSVIEQLTVDDERTTNVKIEVAPHLAERVDRINMQSVTDSDPVYVDGIEAKPCPAHGPHPHATRGGVCNDCMRCGVRVS